MEWFETDQYFKNLEELKNQFTIGQGYLASENLRLLKNPSDINRIIPEDMSGVYFLFSDYPRNLLTVPPGYNWEIWDKGVEVPGGGVMHCLYNGKARELRKRVSNLLFNSGDQSPRRVGDNKPAEIKKSFHNGINLADSKTWGRFNFGIITIPVQEPYMAAAIESLFVEINGRPPLVSRIG